MKNTFIALGVLVVVIGIGWFALGRPATLSSVSKDDNKIFLYIQSGDVSYKNEGEAAFIRATSSPVSISENTRVYTGLGKATILFPNNSTVTLDEYTELEVRYSKEKITFLQTLGSTYHRVEALITGQTYEVETPGTVASVRGTKFAVNYDKNTKTTKVAVTEHKVHVAKFETKQENGTTTKTIVESTDLEEGKIAKVDLRATSTITIVETAQDTDMSSWVEENKVQDAIETKLKEENASVEKIREEIKTILREVVTEESPSTRTTPDTQSEVRTETRNESEAQKQEIQPKPEPTTTRKTTTEPAVTTKPAEAETRIITETRPTTTTTVTKLSEEAFFDKFNDLFFRNFYVDTDGVACAQRVTPSERVRIVTSFATESGYPFTSSTLLDFATRIDQHCKSPSASTQASLQTRFDKEFPFQQEL